MAILNTFMTYLFLLLIIVFVAGCGMAAGLFLRRKIKGNKTENQEKATE